MSLMGYDATTFGNHEFDLGPDGLGKSIGVAAKAGRIPAVLASNTNFAGSDATLADLQRLAKDGVIRRHLVIERGGIRFGIFGVLGKEAMFYTTGAGAVTFSDAIETAKEMVKVLRETEKVDVVICLSHGGLEKGKDGRYTDGDDVRLAKAVPGIDVVIGGHSHTELQEAIIVNDRTPVVQTGKEGREPRRTGDHAGRRQADGRVLPAPPDRRHHCRRPGHRRRDRQAQEDGHRGRVRVARLQHRSAAGGGAAGPAQHVHRHRRRHAPRQPRHRRLQKRHEGGHRVHRQRDDARRLYPREVGRADRLRRVRRGAPRRRCGGYDGRQRARDRLLHRPGAEASARVLARGQPGPPRRVFPPRLRHEVPLRPVAPEVRRRDGHRAGRPRSRLPARSTSAGRTSACTASPAP